jgi:hypothetical protein
MYGQSEVNDYCNDLNAMHEAESVIFARELENSWIDWLVKVVSGDVAHWSDYNYQLTLAGKTGNDREGAKRSSSRSPKIN